MGIWNKLAVVGLGIGMLAASGEQASAANVFTTTGDLTVSAQVIGVCSTTMTSLSFGSYSKVTAVNGTGGNLGVTCTNGISYTITKNGGLNSANVPSGSTYAMNDTATPVNYLGYTLSVTLPASAVAATGSQDDYAITGTIQSGQNAPAGNYSDTVRFTITY